MLADGIYFIGSLVAWRSTAAVLDVPGGLLEDHVQIQQFGHHGGPNQQWEFKSVGGDIYTIVNKHTQKALDVPYGAAIPGCIIQQYTFHGGPNQQWRIETFPAITGELSRPKYHRIYNVQSTLALDVPDGSPNWRIKIQQFTPRRGWNQAWIISTPETYPYPA